jgi:hypothetical protein
MSEKAKPIFHRRIFWNQAFEKLDYDLLAVFINIGHLGFSTSKI